MKKILSCITAAAMLAGTCSFSVFAEEEGMPELGCITVLRDGDSMDYIYVDEDGNEVDMFDDLVPNVQGATVSQSYYNLYDDNRMTSVKDQGGDGICWAFAGVACAESSMITQKLANTSVNYSEKHLAWFTNGAASSNTSDPLYGDGDSFGVEAYNTAGNGWDVTATLGRWSGAELESNVPQSTDTAVSESRRYASYAHLQNTNFFDVSDKNSIKKAIIENGGVLCVYYSEYYTKASDYTAYYQTKTLDSVDTNHVVTIVGWDDNFSKSKFTASGTPSSDGAWLVKNSWGSNWGTDGLFWMSYEEPTMAGLCSFKMESADNYGNIYQYDGTGIKNSNYYYFTDNSIPTAANVFTASSDDYLSAVSFYTTDASVPYTIKIYTDVSTTPTTGSCVLTQSGTMDYMGYHTVNLSKEIPIKKGSKFAVCVTYNINGAPIYFDNNANKASGQTYMSAGLPSSSSEWYDMGNLYNCNARIKAFTKSDVTEVGTPTLKATAGIGKVTLSWTSVSGATKYRLQRCVNGSSSWSTITYPTGTSYTDSSVSNGTTYKYRILAYVGSTMGDPSNTVTATPVGTVGAPTLKASAGNGKVTLSWTSVTGATKYRLQRCVNGSSSWSTIVYPTGTSYTDSSVSNGTTYKYRIFAYAGSTMGSASNTVTATPVGTVGAATLSATAGNGKVSLSWTSVTGATKYRLQRCVSGSSSWSTIVYPTGTSYTDSSVSNGTTYKYRIFAYAGSTMGSASNTVTATPTGTVGTATLSATAGNGKVNLSWTKVTGATKYRLQRCVNGSSSWSTIVYPTGTSYTDTSVTSGTTYKYRIFAYAGSTMGSASNTVTATPSATSTVQAPELELSVSSGVGTFMWTSVSGATKYRLQRYDYSTSSWSTILYTTGTSYTENSTESNSTYKYRVFAYSGTTMSEASNVITIGTNASNKISFIQS